ncbi:multidrug and toxic compound extrusion (MATE) family protein [Skeletonema marinoi]|uniref:Multidrug and toxic compound extrusion (MATE) family protein n=1 Tax=Skeletonema marinoi TaxID=267567 RepID=A0AAD8Y808_9STRA|nr:multidrug and toxic compound extrusion (MATE) family protein [Skeletonema marinoi]
MENSSVEEEPSHPDENDEGDVFRDDNLRHPQQSSSDIATDTPISHRNHLIDVTKITYPIILSEIFQNTLPLIDLAFVGQLGKDELAAAALATVWFNLWNSTMTGFMTAIDTFLAQSYGANQYDNFGAWTGSSLVVTMLATIIVSGVIAACGPAMHLFGQQPELADAAGEFSYRLIPGLFPFYGFKVFTKYLQSQNKLAPSVIIGIIANGLNALFNWGLIYRVGGGRGLGLMGAAWATSLTRAVQFVLIGLFLYTQKNKLKETWPTIQIENLRWHVIKPFIKLAISGALSISAEAWSFEVTTILSGLLGTVELDAHVICLNMATFLFLSFPFAIGIAASIRVGQLIGELKPVDAQRSTRMSFLLTLVFQIILIAIIVPFKDSLGGLFTSDEDVANLVADIIPIWCVFMIGDSVQAVTGGVLRGLGKQKLCLLLNILGFWVLGVPIGAALTFAAGLGVFGLWWGLVIGIYCTAIIGILILRFRMDWRKEAEKSIKRLSTLTSRSTKHNGIGDIDEIVEEDAASNT